MKPNWEVRAVKFKKLRVPQFGNGEERKMESSKEDEQIQNEVSN